MITTPWQGLTADEAANRLKKIGANELPQEKKDEFWKKSLELFKEPMILLLIAAATIYLAMGDLGEGLLLGLSVFVVIGISLYQEKKSARALAALRELSSPRALVIRDGIEIRIAARDLVPGDLISLHEGDRVPADGILLEASNLSIDESLLTGESLPVKKSPTDRTERRSEVFSSTLIISGTAFAEVTRTGAETEIGKIGKSLLEAEPERAHLTKEIHQIVALFAWSGGIVCLLLVVIYGLTRNDWMQALLLGLATAMALLPEEFPVVLSVFLAMGAWRLSKVQVLIRRSTAIERLGAVTVLCVDKTGTLTQNLMTVAGLENGTSFIAVNAASAGTLPEEYHHVVEYGVLASHLDPFDPMEKAVRRLIEKEAWGADHLHRDWRLIKDYPLSDKLLAMSCVWQRVQQEDSYVVAAKGAPEAVVDLCHLPRPRQEEIEKAVKQMASAGLRVLGVAKASFPHGTLPTNQHDFVFEWIGLLGLEDPLRPEVPAAVQICRQAGVRVLMMTGDYPETALKIAAQAGLETAGGVLTGADLRALTDDAVKVRLREAPVFARMSPDQKLRVVKLLKSTNEVVGMTGDGVNDAPSLKWADVGIAMGARGTDVAREAADIVLLDDHFSSIVAGIERGRTIFTNIRKAMSYIAAVHIPIAGLAILPVLFGWPLILYPAHIVFLELIIDPVCSLLFESQEPALGSMTQPPRSLKIRLFEKRDLLSSFVQGGFVLAVSAIGFWLMLKAESPESLKPRSFAFALLILGNLGLIFADLSGGSPRELRRIFKKSSNWFIVIGIIAGAFVVLQAPYAHDLFHLEPLTTLEIVIVGSIALGTFAILSIWNWLVARSGIMAG